MDIVAGVKNVQVFQAVYSVNVENIKINSIITVMFVQIVLTGHSQNG